MSKAANHTPIKSDSTQISLFGFRGRLTRAYYWAYLTIWQVLIFILCAPLYILTLGSSEIIGATNSLMLALLIALLAVIGLVYTHFCLMVRRLHDLGCSAWHCLWIFVPIINVAFVLWLLFFRGTRQANAYGDAPQPPPLEIKLTALLGVFLLIALFLALLFQMFLKHIA